MAFLPPTDATDAFWRAFCAATGTDPATPCVIDRFGAGGPLTGELVALVESGPKRATASLVLDYRGTGDELPSVGLHTVFVDDAGRPRVVVRTTSVDIRPYHAVDEAFAWDEGEGDRTLASWREDHESYFRRHLEPLGVPFSEDLQVVLERFELLWPRP